MNAISKYLIANRKGEHYPVAPRIVCRDGFSLSVQCNEGAYCTPRTEDGPWLDAEIGFLSAEPELVMGHAEDAERPTETVYPYTPIELIEQLIALHGGSDQLEAA